MIWIHGCDDYRVTVLMHKGVMVVDKCGLVTLQGGTFKGFTKIKPKTLEDEFYPAEVVKGAF